MTEEQKGSGITASDVQKMIEASLLPIKEKLDQLARYRVVPVSLQTGEIVEKAREAAIETARREVGLSKRLDELGESIKKTGEAVGEIGKSIEETTKTVTEKVEEISKSIAEGIGKITGTIKEGIKEGFEDVKKWWKGEVEVARRIDWGDVLGEFKEGELTEEQIAILKRVEEALRKRG